MRAYSVWSDTPDKYSEARIIFLDTEESNWAYDEHTQQYYWHRFYSSQPDLNYDNPRVQQAMLDVMKFWLDMGIDGFRVDAVPYLIEREGTNCENLPETHAYLKRMRAFVESMRPDAVLLAEANQWARDLLPYFGNGDEFQMCFHFPVMPRLYMALAKEDRSSVVEVLADTPEIPHNAQWMIFLRNHDELTLEMVTPEERDFMWEHYSPDPKQRINLGIRRRLAPLMENDRRRIELMHSMLFTLPGTPMLYYGDEIGMGDNVSLFDRNGVRTPMQWSDETNGGFSTAPADLLYAPVINDPEFGYQTVNVESQIADPNSQLHTVRQMILQRKQLRLLAKGQLIWLDELPEHLLCFWRVSERDKLLALHNLSDQAVTITLPEDAREYRNALWPQDDTIRDQITLPPYGYQWLLPVAETLARTPTGQPAAQSATTSPQQPVPASAGASQQTTQQAGNMQPEQVVESTAQNSTTLADALGEEQVQAAGTPETTTNGEQPE